MYSELAAGALTPKGAGSSLPMVVGFDIVGPRDFGPRFAISELKATGNSMTFL